MESKPRDFWVSSMFAGVSVGVVKDSSSGVWTSEVVRDLARLSALFNAAFECVIGGVCIAIPAVELRSKIAAGLSMRRV